MNRLLLFLFWIILAGSVVAQQQPGAGISVQGTSAGNSSVAGLEVKVYPNPVESRWFMIEAETLPIREVRISNIAGVQVYQKQLDAPVNKFQVFTDNFPNGIYLLKVTSVNSASKTVKLLIRNK